jgi:TDG/mug DNA glycosylase family protein
MDDSPSRLISFRPPSYHTLVRKGDPSVSERSLKGELGLPPLPQILRPGLLVVFVGFNPGERSAQIGHYYGHPGNRFWWLLHQSGLTERQLDPTEDQTLPDRYGYGLTDIVARPSKAASDLAGWELREGRQAFLDRMNQVRPAFICYNGKGVYAAAAQKKEVAYGLQPDCLIPGARDFVAASPSGRSREPIAVKLAIMTELAELVRAYRLTHPERAPND